MFWQTAKMTNGAQIFLEVTILLENVWMDLICTLAERVQIWNKISTL